MKRLLILMVFALLVQTSYGQSWHWVFFTDKDGVSFDPQAYFDEKALERRLREGLPLNHETDWPVKSDYILAVAEEIDSVSYASRWFNALAVYGEEEAVQALTRHPFVKEVKAMIPLKVALAFAEGELSEKAEEIRKTQIQIMGADRFRQAGIDGAGVRIAIFDAGFPDVDTHPAFKALRANNQIKATYDFVQNGKKVYGHSSHGTSVLSCIAGLYEPNREAMGLATGAEFILARTERGLLEPFSEEKNWVAALEWADKEGADLVNSSLGYTYHRYYPYEMDGKTSLVSRAASMAFSKGILVVNSAGNEGGDDDWKVIGTPADADGVLSVGGIDPTTNYHSSFSSFGPTADGRMKPNVSGYGTALVAQKGGEYGLANGTSFASPLVCGFAACARQMAPDLPVKEFMKEIEASGSLYPFFDYAHGYGVPHADYFFEGLIEKTATFTWTLTESSIQIQLNQVPFDEYLGPVDIKPNLFFHYQKSNGRLANYGVYDIEEDSAIEMQLPPKGQVLRIHYAGYTEEISR